MRELGYREGKDFRIECRHGNGHYAGLPAAAEELVQLKPAVILALGEAYTRAATRATKDIPIVMVTSSDPVASGFAASYARPGGNATGLTYYGEQLSGKRLELLKGIVPNLNRVALLLDPGASPELRAVYERDVHRAARDLHVELVIYRVHSQQEIERAFAEIERQQIQAVYVLPYFAFSEHAQQIADLSRIQGLPSIHFLRRYPAIGGLMSYGPDYDMLHKRSASYVDRILKGANPGELPIDKPERLYFVINRATAQELGLTVPASLLLRADKVIE